MKTLYININGENIQSTEYIIVIGRPEDTIVNKFFFELGKEILKGVVAPGVSGIKKKDIVMDFKAHDEKSFNGIMDQWETLKLELLGDKPSGTRTINLPEDYITWLQNSSQPSYVEIAKSLYNRGGKVEVSLDKIYKNAIGIIVNNIEPKECKDCERFVVNDDVVTDDSAITCSIQERLPQIAFVPFEDFGKCPKCGKKPCECKAEEQVCPKCSKNPCECLQSQNENYIFAIGKGRYTFYNKKGILISSSEFQIIAKGYSSSKRMMRHVLVQNNENRMLYFVSSAKEALVEIGEYIGWDSDYAVEIHYDKYILYRNKRNYRLYEICNDSSLFLKFDFNSKVVFWGKNVIISGNYIQNDSYTIDMTNGDIVSLMIQYHGQEETNVTMPSISFQNNIVVSNKRKKNIYHLIEGERFIGSTSSFFVVAGNGYIEKYNENGQLLTTIETYKGASNFILWKNGFVSFNCYSFCGFYDREGKEHLIAGHSYLSHGWLSSGPKIVEIISDNCIHIKEEVYKGRAKKLENYLVDYSDKIIVKNPLNFIDGNNNYGDGFSIEKIDDNFLFCQYTKREKGEFKDLKCIVNGEKGIVIGEVKRNSFQEIYLIK